MDRRAFLAGIGATLAAPAIVKAESLMRVASVRRIGMAPELAMPYRGGFTAADLQQVMDGVVAHYMKDHTIWLSKCAAEALRTGLALRHMPDGYLVQKELYLVDHHPPSPATGA